jgi:NAD(P)H-hydrate epimerase
VQVVSVAQMRALEAAAGVPEATLQERAALQVADAAARLLEPGQRVGVFVGHGNNGRDGALAGEILAGRGFNVEMLLGARHALTAAELDRFRAAGVRVVDRIDQADLAVDALVGIGTHGALREPLAGSARALNALRPAARVLAVDVPSGIDSDSGAVEGEAVRADVTVTLGAVKQGLLRFPAAEHVGRLEVRDIGVPPAEGAPDVLDAISLAGLVPDRPLAAHKYGFGRVLVVAGSDHFLGAPVLCAGAAARSGAGLITIASTRDVRLTVATHLPEVTYTIQDVHVDSDPLGSARGLEPYLRSHRCLVLGPGLGRGANTTAFVRALLRARRPETTMVIDADALFALADISRWWTLVDAHVALTPHGGELDRLEGASAREDEPPWQRAARLAQRWGCVLVAKGPFTAVAAPDGRVSVWPHANAALATAGTGDVLAGLLGGLAAQGLTVDGAAKLAVGVHALAARQIIGTRNWRTLLASDLLPALPAVLHTLRAAP